MGLWPNEALVWTQTTLAWFALHSYNVRRTKKLTTGITVMIKNTSIILVINIFLFSGMANAEKVNANVQDGTNGTRSDPTSDVEDTAQQEKHTMSNEISSGTAKPDQREKTYSPSDSPIGASEEKIVRDKAAEEIDREMAARVRAEKRGASREMAARVRAEKREASREMAARVRTAREEAAREMAARVRAAREEADREMAARVGAAKEEAAREMAARAKERAARERDYHERLDRYEAERKYFKEERGYYRAPY